MVFWRDGFFDTSIDVLTREMGINRFSLYATFGSKDELFTRALQSYRARVMSGILAPLETADADVDSIREFFEELMVSASGPNARWGCLMVNTAAELSAHDHEACEEVAGYRDHLTGLFARALAQSRQREQLVSENDISAMASYLFGLVLGISVYAKCAPSEKALRDFLDRGLSALESS